MTATATAPRVSLGIFLTMSESRLLFAMLGKFYADAADNLVAAAKLLELADRRLDATVAPQEHLAHAGYDTEVIAAKSAAVKTEMDRIVTARFDLRLAAEATEDVICARDDVCSEMRNELEGRLIDA